MAHKKRSSRGGYSEDHAGEKVMHTVQSAEKKAYHGYSEKPMSKHGHQAGYAPGKGFPEGHDEMVGRHDFAGLPPEVRMTVYPKANELRDEMIDDTMSDVDAIHKHCEGKRREYLSFQK